MKIYIDLAKQAITNTSDDKVYEGDFYSNVFEVLFYNYEDDNWFPTMSQLAPNGRKAGDFTADALGVGESHTYVEDGKTYLRFTFTMGATWVLMKGKSNFYIWINRLNGTLLKKCVGMVNIMIDQSTDNYFIADVTFNPNVKAYIDSCIDEQNEVIAQLGTGEPKYFDTAANIALLEEDKGLAVATDTGYVFYWDVTEDDATKYKNSGLQYTNLSAYYTKTEADALLANKADKSTTYTKTESDNKFAPKTTAITHTGNQLQDYSGNNVYPTLDNQQVEENNIKDLNVTAKKTNFMTDNIFYHNDEVKVNGTTYWNGVGIEFDVSTINEGDVYYLKIDSVSNNMTSDVALLRTWQNGVAYAVRTMTITQVQNGETINIQIPSNCTRFGVWLMRNNSGSTTESGTTTFNGINLYKNGDHLIRTLASDVVIPQLNDDVKKLGYWYGKKIAWFGTSIPAGSYDASDEHRYPDIVGNLLGATIYNEAVGSSSITRCNPNSINENNPYGFDTNDWLYAVRGLAQTLEEKQWLLDNYNNINVFTVNTWDFLDDYRINLVKSYSYEQKIAKYLTGGSVGNVDLYVFDHGFNDIFNNTTYNYSILKETYGENNRYCYQGGMNYLLNYIFTKNPDAKIIILSHYSDNATDHTHNTTAFVEALKENQIAVAKRWNLNFLDLTSMLGWSGQKITTTGYWDNNTHEWVNSGGASQNIQIKDIHVRDTVHPYTDASGKSNTRIAEVISTYIKNSIR